MPITTAAERTLHKLRALCLALPETRETSSWGHPNFKAGSRTFVAFERVKGRPSIAFRLDPADVERLLKRKSFFTTPYGRGMWVSLWADATIDWKAVADLVERSYRVVALKRMLKEMDKSCAT
ncbi:MAG TPA: MmcQ/YjbR family DNA-binding protein [Vicinamibacterales bacterium]